MQSALGMPTSSSALKAQGAGEDASVPRGGCPRFNKSLKSNIQLREKFEAEDCLWGGGGQECPRPFIRSDFGTAGAPKLCDHIFHHPTMNIGQSETAPLEFKGQPFMVDSQ